MAAASAVFRGVITTVDRAEPLWRSQLRSAWCTAREWFGGQDAGECVMNAHAAHHFDSYGFIATFEVLTVWKGPDRLQLRVRTDTPGAGSCGLLWRPGDEWIIYAHGSTLPSTNGCARNRFGERLAEESTLLDALTSPPGGDEGVEQDVAAVEAR